MADALVLAPPVRLRRRSRPTAADLALPPHARFADLAARFPPDRDGGCPFCDAPDLCECEAV